MNEKVNTLFKKVDYWRTIFPQAKVYPISALNGFFISEVFNLIMELVPNSPAYFPKDQITDKPERFFVNESIRKQILQRYKNEIPYSVEVITEEFKESPKIIKISSVILVERETQKGIIIGHKGNALKQVGISARKSLQNFFAQKWPKMAKNRFFDQYSKTKAARAHLMA